MHIYTRVSQHKDARQPKDINLGEIIYFSKEHRGIHVCLVHTYFFVVMALKHLVLFVLNHLFLQFDASNLHIFHFLHFVELQNPLYCPIRVELGVRLRIDQILTIFPKFSNYTYFIARNDDYIYTMAHCMMIQFLYFLLRFSFILPFSFLVTYIFYTTSNVQRRTRQ